MNQYYVTFKDKSFEYVYAYGYKEEDGRYKFDEGGGNFYYVTKSIVKSIELL